MKVSGLMSYNIDGYNERNNFIRNSNDMNNLRKSGPSNFDNSFAKMRSEERRNLVQTTDSNTNAMRVEETRGNIDNFVVRNSHMNNLNRPLNQNNPVQRAMNNNMFKKVN